MLTNPLSKPNEALSSLDKPILAISRLQLHVSFKEHLKYVCEYQGAVVAPWFGDRIGSVTTFSPLVRTTFSLVITCTCRILDVLSS